MGNATTGTSGSSKSGTTGLSTGTPAWTSGATGNNGTTQPPTQVPANTGLNGAYDGSAASASSPSIQGSNWYTPGTDDYNNMNTLLATQPMGNIVNLLQNGGLGGLSNEVMQNLAGSDGSNNWMDQAAQMFGQANDRNNALFTQLGGNASAAQKYLGSTAAGDFLTNNPYVEGIVRQGQEEAGTGVNQMFAAGGRYGGGVNQGTLADSYQNVGNQFRGANYDAERNRQLQAAGLISSEEQANRGLQANLLGQNTAAASGLGGLGQNAQSNWMQSQSGAAGLQNQGIQNQLQAMGLLPTVQGNKMFDSQQQQGIGSSMQAETQKMLEALSQQWSQGDMQDWARLGGLLSAGTGSAGNYGTSNSTQKSTQPMNILGALGGLLSIL